MNTSEAVAHVGLVEVTLAATVLVAAVIALYGRHRLAGIVGFIVFGVLLSTWWGVIGAPDVALAEAAIGTGVTAALFVHAATLLRTPEPEGEGRGATILSVAAGLVLGVVIGSAVTRASAELPRPEALANEVADELSRTGVEHPITAVLLNFRSLDTLLEIVVLLAATAIAAAFLPAPLCAPQGARSTQEEAGSASTLTIVTHYVRLTAPFLVLLAAWLLFAGSSRPGGAFQAGAVLAAILIGLHVAGVARLRPTPLLRLLATVGILSFLVVAVGGWLATGSWLGLRSPGAGPITIALEAVLTVSIGVSLALVYLGAARRDP